MVKKEMQLYIVNCVIFCKATMFSLYQLIYLIILCIKVLKVLRYNYQKINNLEKSFIFHVKICRNNKM